MLFLSLTSALDPDTPSLSTDKYEEHRRQWGGGLRGSKSAEKMRQRAKSSGQTLAAMTAAGAA
jgi:hypothetical protein